MKSLRKWLDNFIARLNCRLNGHGPYKVLEVYSTTQVVRDFASANSKIIRVMRATPRKIKVLELQKRICHTCKRVSVDLVHVGDQSPQD